MLPYCRVENGTRDLLGGSSLGSNSLTQFYCSREVKVVEYTALEKKFTKLGGRRQVIMAGECTREAPKGTIFTLPCALCLTVSRLKRWASAKIFDWFVSLIHAAPRSTVPPERVGWDNVSPPHAIFGFENKDGQPSSVDATRCLQAAETSSNDDHVYGVAHLGWLWRSISFTTQASTWAGAQRI
jgi:hypothetical protein